MRIRPRIGAVPRQRPRQVGGPVRVWRWFALLAAVFTLCQAPLVLGRTSPDTGEYLYYALRLTGESRAAALHQDVAHDCADLVARTARARSQDVKRLTQPVDAAALDATCRTRLHAAMTHDRWRGTAYERAFARPRFAAIFAARPGYPVLLAPFIAVAGVTGGLWLCSLATTLGCAALVLALLRRLGAPPVAALAGAVLLLVLPPEETLMRPMSEGPLLLGVLGALLGTQLVLERRRSWVGWAVLAGSLGFAYAVKYSTAEALAGCLAVGAAALALTSWRSSREDRRGGLALAGACGGAAVVMLAGASLLRLPGASESLQDLFTDHYAKADVASPLHLLARLEVGFWREWLRRELATPLLPALAALAAWAAWRHARRFAPLLFAAAAAGLVNQAAHPDVGIGDRLNYLVWLLPVLGAPLALKGRGERREAEETAPHPATDAPLPTPVP